MNVIKKGKKKSASKEKIKTPKSERSMAGIPRISMPVARLRKDIQKRRKLNFWP